MLKRSTVFVSLLVFSVAAFAQKPAPKPKTPAKSAAHVTNVHLEANPPFKNYNAGCPVRVTFQAAISTDGPANVGYTFESSDGHPWVGHMLTFTGAGTKQVPAIWTINKDFSGWLVLKPAKPYNYIESTRAFFNVKCKGHAKGK